MKDIEIILDEEYKINLISKAAFDNVTIHIITYDNIIYSIYLERIEIDTKYWFLPDNRLYINNESFLEILDKNNSVIFREQINITLDNLYFYSYFHNGDIHYSREFVKDIISKTNFKNYYYAHINKIGLLKDVSKLKEIKYELIGDLHPMDYFIKNGDLYINTWIGKSIFKYIDDYGFNISSMYNMYKNIYKFLNINLNEDETSYIPRIDFDKVEKNKIDSFFENNNKKNILICNGIFNSTQSTVQKFEPFILDLSEKFPNFNYIFTDNSVRLNGKNIFYTNDIIEIDTNLKIDLLEISYLSTYCDIIIGKSSGPFIFATIYDNLMNENVTFIDFCNIYDWIIYPRGKCEYLWSNDYDFHSMYDLIKKTIENHSINK